MPYNFMKETTGALGLLADSSKLRILLLLERNMDLKSLGDCTEYQKKTGKCSMETFLEYMEQRKRSRRK